MTSISLANFYDDLKRYFKDELPFSFFSEFLWNYYEFSKEENDNLDYKIIY